MQFMSYVRASNTNVCHGSGNCTSDAAAAVTIKDNNNINNNNNYHANDDALYTDGNTNNFNVVNKVRMLCGPYKP